MKVKKEEESVMWKCVNCGKFSNIMFICSGCYGVIYCDEVCQERDWCKYEDYCINVVKVD